MNLALWDKLVGVLRGSPAVDYDVLREEAAAARRSYWAQVGEVDDHVLTHLISPSFMGGARWPSLAQAYRVVRRGGATILATEGLSNPFDDGRRGGGVGLGIELFLETEDLPDAHAGTGGLPGAWAMQPLVTIAGDFAASPQNVSLLDRLGVLSTQNGGVSGTPALAEQMPARFVTADDNLGFLIGAPAADFAPAIPGMTAPVRAVPLVLLTAAELEQVRSGGAAARRKMAEALARSPTGHLCSLSRDSLA